MGWREGKPIFLHPTTKANDKLLRWSIERQGNTHARRRETAHLHTAPAIDDSSSWQVDFMKGSDWRQQQALIPPCLWRTSRHCAKTFLKIKYLVGNCPFLIFNYLVEKNYIFMPSHCSLSQTHLCGGDALCSCDSPLCGTVTDHSAFWDSALNHLGGIRFFKRNYSLIFQTWVTSLRAGRHSLSSLICTFEVYKFSPGVY